MLIGLLAALALPGLVRATGSAALRVAAYQVSALLREARSSALRTGTASITVLDGHGRRVRSQTSSAFVLIPAGAQAAILRSEGPSIRFYADGRSSGGDIAIESPSSRFLIAVSPDTGAIHVAEP